MNIKDLLVGYIEGQLWFIGIGIIIVYLITREKSPKVEKKKSIFKV